MKVEEERGDGESMVETSIGLGLAANCFSHFGKGVSMENSPFCLEVVSV